MSRSPALLSEVVDGAPARMLTVRVAPRGLDVPVLASVLLDVTDPQPAAGEGAMLHLVGVLPDEPAASELLRAADRLGYSAVTIKRRGRPLLELSDLASGLGVAVLEAADDAGWSAVHAAVTSVIAAAGLRTSPTRATASDELHEIANAVAAAFGGSVSIEDLDRRVIAYSSIPGQRIDSYREAGILQRLVPSRESDRQQYSEVYTAADVIRFAATQTELPRSAIAIRAGDVPLGTMWAIEPDEGVSPAQVQSLRDGATVAAVHLLRLRHADEIGQLARGEALVSLLDSGLPTEALLARIGVPLGAARMMLVAPVQDRSRTQLSAVGAAAGRYLSAYAPSAVVASLPGWACVLMPDRGDAETQRLARGVSAEAARAAGSGVRVAFSSPGVFPTDLAALYAEVSETASVADAIGLDQDTVHLTDISDHVLLRVIDDVIAQRPRLDSPAVTRLLAHDADRGSDLALTMLLWLEEQGDAVVVAERLSTHPNTVRYRVRRAFEVMGHPPWDPDTRLTIWMRLRRSLRDQREPRRLVSPERGR